MFLLVRIGWRNLWRNPRRTLLTALALGLGLALLLVSAGLLDGGHEERVSMWVRLGSGGHVVVQADGYNDTRTQNLLLTAATVSATEEFLRTTAVEYPLRGISPRLLASGLLSSAANTSGVVLVGVLPAAERSAFLIPQRIVEGTYLRDGSAADLVIGAELARKLQVKVGSKVVLMAQLLGRPESGRAPGGAGEIQSSLFRITGVFRTGLQEIDGQVVHLPLPAAQSLLGVPDRVTQVAIFLDRGGDSLSVARGLRKQMTGAGTEVLTWWESSSGLAWIFWLENASGAVVTGILLIMVGLGMLNTILMAVLERSHEFGVCAALGLRPRQLAGMIISEALALTVISLGLGLAIGFGIHSYFAAFGLDLRWLFGAALPTTWTVFPPLVYSRLSCGRVSWSVGIVFVMAAVMSLYPVLKAARTKLPEALRIF